MQVESVANLSLRSGELTDVAAILDFFPLGPLPTVGSAVRLPIARSDAQTVSEEKEAITAEHPVRRDPSDEPYRPRMALRLAPTTTAAQVVSLLNELIQTRVVAGPIVASGTWLRAHVDGVPQWINWHLTDHSPTLAWRGTSDPDGRVPVRILVSYDDTGLVQVAPLHERDSGTGSARPRRAMPLSDVVSALERSVLIANTDLRRIEVHMPGKMPARDWVPVVLRLQSAARASVRLGTQ
jgi:hypothetical protein